MLFLVLSFLSAYALWLADGKPVSLFIVAAMLLYGLAKRARKIAQQIGRHAALG